MKLLHYEIGERKIGLLEVAVILITAIIPLFFNHPYRINLFLAWEGAFRLAQGEIPYRDFGSPVGYGFWILPALFFKIFGPYVYTLLVVQAFINIVSGLAFRAFLKIFSVPPPIRWLSILVYCLSYSMFNFWPWYNHLVFVFELIGIYFLCAEVLKPKVARKNFPLIISSFFIALSFLTKQDTGALAFLIAILILTYDFIVERNLKTGAVFILSYIIFLALLIVPFLPYDFTYWFNMGQFPHNARVDKFDIINEFLGGSSFIKLYLIVVAFIIIYTTKNVRDFKENKSFYLFALVVISILGQASIIQVTSYTPLDGNIYFHSFAFAFIGIHFSNQFAYSRLLNFVLLTVLVGFWWSGVFWNRFLRERIEKILTKPNSEQEHVISKRNYLLSSDSVRSNRSSWKVGDIASFKRIKIPESTTQGIHDIMSLPEAKKSDLKILNMSELTPLAFDMSYQLEKDQYHPLWFHKGVSFFDREVKRFCGKISAKEYDIILFEDIPNVNQFYPYEVRDCVKENYVFRFKFLAPRVPEFCYIEVYTKE